MKSLGKFEVADDVVTLGSEFHGEPNTIVDCLDPNLSVGWHHVGWKNPNNPFEKWSFLEVVNLDGYKLHRITSRGNVNDIRMAVNFYDRYAKSWSGWKEF